MDASLRFDSNMPSRNDSYRWKSKNIKFNVFKVVSGQMELLYVLLGSYTDEQSFIFYKVNVKS